MIQRNIRMEPELLDALDQAVSANRIKTRSEAVRRCIRRWSTVLANEVVGVAKKTKYPTTPGKGDPVTLELLAKNQKTSATLIRCMIAASLAELPEPSPPPLVIFSPGVDYLCGPLGLDVLMARYELDTGDKQTFAKYDSTDKGITKDGHIMFPEDIAKDLNRKSFLEGENAFLKTEIKRIKGWCDEQN